ncbi:beta-mannosidase [Actinopolyspora erythraea]|uniref:Beta-mannosidase n=1 Tax=Actinopolyspora erythraea TaxID=414996 RepID=A0A099D6B1_9ACTN|nr:cellulase family glycosylhydrolase [Actinopolyspora erythraea]ASU78759.1 beta-mannosidase [Actinopolyspora erythraea]KGI81514.1 beta-mannosidase [Actinopolyspora erythraea]
MRRGFAFVETRDGPATWFGANFWSAAGGPRMWSRYDPELIRAELAVLREHGLTLTRSFFFWPDFMPEPHHIDESCAAAYSDFLNAHVETGMRTIPTFLVGHMSGENFDPPWRHGRDLYRDVWMLDRQSWFIERLTARYADHPAVAGWLISNEMPIYGDSAERESVTAWAGLMVRAVRAGGGTQPVSIGDGAWGAEVTGSDNGFSVRDLASLTDFLGPHVYRMEDDRIRQHFGAAFICELTSTLGSPVVLEEFGLSSEFASDEHAATYYRQVLHNSLLAGATGWIAWNNTDFDGLAGQDPYRHHPFELHFGLTTSEREPKPQLREMARFADTLSAIDVLGCRREPARAAMIVPEHLEGDLPISDGDDARFAFSTLRQAYTSAKLAGLPVGLCRERDGLAEDCSLYLLPSAKQLTAPSVAGLEELAASGAVVYLSYCHGTGSFQRGPWIAGLNRSFGVEHQLWYGEVDPIEPDEVELTFRRDFGALAAGEKLRVPVAGNRHSRARLPVRATEAEILAVDQDGEPAVLRRSVGSGWMVLCAYPIEHMADWTPAANPDAAVRLYDALADFAGMHRAVRVADPAVGVDVLRHRDGRRFVFVTSHSPEPLRVTPEVAGGELTELDDDKPVDTLELPPYEVRVLSFSEFDAA